MVGVSSCFGSIIYLQVERITTKNGPAFMTFGSIFLIDFVVLLFLIPLILCGLYGADTGGHGADEDEKEAEYMDDKGVGDVPFG